MLPRWKDADFDFLKLIPAKSLKLQGQLADKILWIHPTVCDVLHFTAIFAYNTDPQHFSCTVGKKAKVK